MGADQRKAERRALAVLFAARDASGAGTLHFTSEDVSTGGVFLKSNFLLEQGEGLSLEFTVPGRGQVKAQAKVAWVRRFPEAHQPAGMGVEFLAMHDDDKATLSAWLRSGG